MRRNKLETAVKALYLAASVILTASIITIGVIELKQARGLSNAVQNNINSITNDLMANDVMQYDGLVITGSDVVNFYKKHLGSVDTDETPEFTITIVTDTARTYSNGSYLNRLRSNTSLEYIKPVSAFNTTVFRNENGVILNVRFAIC